MASDALCHFQLSAVLQKIRDPCGPKRMERERIRQPVVFEPAFEDVRGVRADERTSDTPSESFR
jgi:hypothetical protein